MALALAAGFLVCDTTLVLAQQYSTGSNHTMTENATMTANATMTKNATKSSTAMTPPKTNETLALGETVKITKNETVIAPPLQQLKNGVSIKDVKCIHGMQLILKKEDGSPACVKPDDIAKLIERGWGNLP